MIKPRLNYAELAPAPYKNMVSALMALEKGALDKATIELMFMRVSQINGCAYCLDMHGKALRESGFSHAKLDTLAGWRVSHEFSERERAALEWAESVTLIAATGAPDSAFEALKAYFSDTEIADLTFAISIMNAFNRLAVSMRQ
ncbi:carboxymuconolactone decarboxylase family protein [Serratia ureilytica]|uniref:carboxymuconolactone decarboxylase family protein n=1 Tax=Serratia ureilytica TaxID=300181 RepID=UPI001C11EDC3|nr:carboxymuconolactone decarboxylase family protein [Serratia ureilytica]MBU5414914.1 carboxymuconolactone decarboxylase family protein [Serratia ureilytica]